MYVTAVMSPISLCSKVTILKPQIWIFCCCHLVFSEPEVAANTNTVSYFAWWSKVHLLFMQTVILIVILTLASEEKAYNLMYWKPTP